MVVQSADGDSGRTAARRWRLRRRVHRVQQLRFECDVRTAVAASVCPASRELHTRNVDLSSLAERSDIT